MDVVSLIQARMSSARLPGKVLLPLGEGTVLDQVIARAGAFSSQVVVCTSVDSSDDPVADHCESHGVLCIRGCLDDVFQRFRSALEDPRVKDSAAFARVTGDSPLLSVEIAELLCASFEPGLAYARPNYDMIPLGVGCELVDRATFMSLDPAGLDTAEREHVTLALYERKGAFRTKVVDVPAQLHGPELRLTLDYPEDYELLRRVYDELGAPDTAALIRELRARPDWIGINAGRHQRVARGPE